MWNKLCRRNSKPGCSISEKRNEAPVWGPQFFDFSSPRMRQRLMTCLSRLCYSFAFLSRSALLITDTELNVIAAAAIIGLSSKPKKG